MRLKKYISILLVATFLGSSLITGCNQDEAKIASGLTKNSVKAEERSTDAILEAEIENEEVIIENEPTTVEETSEETTMLLLTITIVNQCGADIGMFSVIDPVTNEQVNVGSIINGESISIQANWPIGITDFQWAIYNKKGELYTEATSDISQAKESVVITLQGEGSIDTIDTTFQ